MQMRGRKPGSLRSGERYARCATLWAVAGYWPVSTAHPSHKVKQPHPPPPPRDITAGDLATAKAVLAKRGWVLVWSPVTDWWAPCRTV